MKSKKHKKDKKNQKKEKRRQRDDSSEDSSGGEMEWVEAPSASKNPAPPPDKSCDPTPSSQGPTGIQRDGQKAQVPVEDDWLASPFLTVATSLSDIRKKKNDEKEKEREKNGSLASVDVPGQFSKELNPYWKDGGTGLPENRQASHSNPKSGPGPGVRRPGIGADGGVGWLKKAFQRAVEQARESGRSVGAVVADRWGSMAEYERLLAEAKAASGGGGQGRGARGPRGPPGPRGPTGPPPGWKHRREDGERSSSREQDGERHRGERDGERGGRDDRRDIRDGSRGDNDRRRDGDRDRYDQNRMDRDRDRTSEGSSGSRGFRRPGDSDRGSRDMSDLRSKFKKPGDDDDDQSRSDSRSRDGGSSRGERRDEGDERGWRKGGFRKPGDYDADSKRQPSSSSSSRSYPSSSSSGGWRKSGFKKPGEQDTDNLPSSRSSRDSPSPSSSSSNQGWRKSGFQRPGQDEDVSREPAKSSRDRLSPPSRPSQDSANEDRRRRKDSSSSDDDDNSDEVRSSASPSSNERKDARNSGKGGEQEEVKERSPSPVKILSDIEMNKLGAKLVKAEIMGNEAQLQKLKAQIEEARQARIAHKTKLLQKGEVEKGDKGLKREKGERVEGEEVILTRTDHSGQSWPLAEATAAPDSGKRKRKKNIVTHDKGGERERYFADDDDVDLETMVRREKMGSTDDHNRLLNKVASKKLALLDSEFNTLDEMFVSGAAHAEPQSRIEERERSRAIAEHRRTMASLSKCPHCLESGQMKKHLIVSLGMKVYLCVPETRCISEGQCYIIPMQHSVASTALDEDVWAEIQVFRKGLTRMFEDHDMDVCFLETCMNPKKQRHMVIECLPIPRDLGEMAPIYFKKAIQESESEWAQNKKLVDTRQKDVRRSIPRGFPYFSVDFGLDGGFAHVIEDEDTFPHYFGKEVIGGLLDVEPRLWRHPPKDNFEYQSKRVLQLSEWWKPFDWTQKIDREKS